MQTLHLSPPLPLRTLAALAATLGGVLLAPIHAPLHAQQLPPPAAASWWRHVTVLAHDSLQGRETGSAGHLSAARYVADQFRAAGLQPGGTDGWFQSVRFVESRLDPAGTTVALREGGGWTPLAIGRDIRLTARLATADVEAPIVFAGYGLSLPDAGIDDLRGLDVRGKIVLHVNSAPKGLAAPLLAHGTRSRWAAMRRAGAVGIIAIGAGNAWTDDGTNRFGTTFALADTALDDTGDQRINATVNPALASRLLAGSAFVWDSIVAQARRGEPLPHGALTVALKATLPTVRRTIDAPNVVGVLPGTDPTLRDEVVVLTAHLDHVGMVRGPALTGDSIFNGAMDNASGSATLMETAQTLALRGGNKRTLVFAAVAAEEKGLLGSRYFAAHPSVTRGTIVANLNTDMFLPIVPLTGVFAYGFEESDLADDLTAATNARGLTVIPDPEPEQVRFVRSDQYSFIRRGIPALALKVGYRPGTPQQTVWDTWQREKYHKLGDDLDQPIDFESAAGFNALYADLATRISNRPTRPAWRANSFFATPVIVP